MCAYPKTIRECLLLTCRCSIARRLPLFKRLGISRTETMEQSRKTKHHKATTRSSQPVVVCMSSVRRRRISARSERFSHPSFSLPRSRGQNAMSYQRQRSTFCTEARQVQILSGGLCKTILWCEVTRSRSKTFPTTFWSIHETSWRRCIGASIVLQRVQASSPTFPNILRTSTRARMMTMSQKAPHSMWHRSFQYKEAQSLTTILDCTLHPSEKGWCYWAEVVLIAGDRHIGGFGGQENGKD